MAQKEDLPNGPMQKSGTRKLERPSATSSTNLYPILPTRTISSNLPSASKALSNLLERPTNNRGDSSIAQTRRSSDPSSSRRPEQTFRPQHDSTLTQQLMSYQEQRNPSSCGSKQQKFDSSLLSLQASSQDKSQLKLKRPYSERNIHNEDKVTKIDDLEKWETQFRIQVFVAHTVICVMCYIRQINQHVKWLVQRELGIERLQQQDGETVEWLNSVIQQIWKGFNPDLLVSVTDMLEDTMNRIAPYFIQAANVETLELGIIAPRVEKIKIIGQREIDGGDELFIGEAHFSFGALAPSPEAQHAPPHVVVSIKTGFKAIIPVKVEILGFSAMIRFEIQLLGTPPFVSKGRFSILNTPVYETSIVSLVPINIAQLPIVKDFLKASVNLVLQEFTYPKFLDLDLAQLLSGDDVKHDTQSIGVVRIDIYEAKDLAQADIRGDNDPYVVTALDPPPYPTETKTRVIENEAHPVWQETHFHKIPELDIVSDNIKIRLSVWDWDRFSNDDHIGSVWFDIKEKIRDGKEECIIHDGWTDIWLNQQQHTRRGSLNCRVLYSPKIYDESTIQENQTSGILALQIHQAMNIQVTAPAFTHHKSSIPLLDHFSGSNFPNPYASVFLNDIQVYRTRTKLNNVAPYWNASTEQFVRDWSTATLRIVIKNQKDLEDDPVIGMVNVSLKNIFEEKPEKDVTKWFPLRDGIGCGKVRISFLFKTVTLKLKPQEKGYDVGTLEVKNLIARDLEKYFKGRNYFVNLELNTTPSHPHHTESSTERPPSWPNVILFPILERYKTCLIFKVRRRNFLGVSRTAGIAKIWLRGIIDLDEQTIYNLPIYEKIPNKDPQNDDEVQQSPQFSNSPRVRGHLEFKIKFLPGLSPLHENLVKRSLTGANASVLSQHPLHLEEENAGSAGENIDPVQEELYRTPQREERRINHLFESQSMRRMQWLNDTLKSRIISFVSRHGQLEDNQAIEREA
ncbi:hypothetical protein G9A89_007898 [Geosiphon pyriformis]|nr:hypothetical protein G9A89_007898 [Geosiphon pyriformis]